MTSALAKIGVISIGDMGMGIAKLLVANGFSVATNCRGRSDDTIERAKSAQVEIYKSDEHLAEAATSSSRWCHLEMPRQRRNVSSTP
ncbi:hypothetical protein NUW58_g8046 [Xylaria curta]|uniref:Uncharacterized protein n=1 Tax=Xylaria curta TaxID=42375 RepID=A0ACC1NBD4_9PEZI|nr:hypothetical protein NUW58_g8046 [Xylaria curta]